MTGLVFTCLGAPVSKGSSRAFIPKGWKRAIITNANAETEPWEAAIVAAAAAAMGTAAMMEGPVKLRLHFFMPRPKSAKKAIVRHLTKPDLDKLTRCVKDALKRAGIYKDDSQVIELEAGKDFADGVYDIVPNADRRVPRVEVHVTEIE